MFDRFITFVAKQTPQSLAVSTLNGHLTFSEFDANIDRFAAAIAEANPPRSGVVGVIIADPYIHWLTLLALARLGIATASYLGAMRRMMEPLLKPDFIVSDEPESADDAQRAPLLRVNADWLNRAARREARPMPRPKVDPDSLARITTSSGTTGVPKKFGATWRTVENQIKSGGMLGASTNAMTRTLSLIGPEFLPYPGAISGWSCGGTVCFGPDNPAAIAQALTRLQPTSLYMAPVQMKVLVDSLPEGFMPFRDLWLSVSGSHTPRVVREQTRMRLTNNLVLIYGTTEAGMIALRPDTLVVPDDADVGWASPFLDVEVVDDADRLVAFGTLGRIRVRGPNVAKGYIDDEEATAKFFRDGWFYPGDVGSIASDGRLRVEGRTDEVMNFGGSKFMPHVIESAVMSCPGVIDAGAFTMLDKAGFDIPWIAIVRGENLREEDVAKALMIPGLPPASVVWTDNIPRTPTGKVHRDQLQTAARELNAGTRKG